MGAKKKGGLANRLAKMSDEDRAKYLQRKADMEEEARRRKEQLVASFMKNKLKREDAFSRLNVAKINQQWHQIMRADKVKDMKEEVEYLRRRMEKIITLKDRTIKKLIEELDWQEDLYGKNFSAHFDHIDKIIEAHSKNLEQLLKQYDSDRKLLLHTGKTERDDYERNIEEEIELLKTVIYGQDVEARKMERETHEDYLKRTDEILSAYKIELSQMKNERERISCILWKQISRVLKTYVQQTDVRRAHLAELQRLDAEGAESISSNQQLINNEEEQLNKLRKEYADLVENREEQVRNLKHVVQLTTQKFFKMRKDLTFELKLDESQLAYMSVVSNKTIEGLEKLANKGEQIFVMIETCKKLETENEKTHRWTPFINEDIIIEESVEHGSKSSKESTVVDIEDKMQYKPKFTWDAFEEALESGDNGSSVENSILSEDLSIESHDQVKSEESEPSEEATEILEPIFKSSMIISKMRPKTAIKKPPRPKYGLRQFKSEESYSKQTLSKSEENQIFKISTRLVKTGDVPKGDQQPKRKQQLKVRPIKSALLPKIKQTSLSLERSLLPLPLLTELKPLKARSSSAPTPLSAFSIPKPKLMRPIKSARFSSENKFEVLDKLEGLWWIYNKVEINCMKLRSEKKTLIFENNKLKDIMKDVLEAAALGQSIPSTKSASTIASRRRFVLSAPISSYSIM